MFRKLYAVFLVWVVLIPGAALAQQYTLTDLGSLSPTGINSWAQVVGNDNHYAFVWSFGHLRRLGTLAGGTFSWAAAINDFGEVTGTADGPGQIVSRFGGSTIECNDLIQPFIWTQQTQMRGVGTVGPASDEASFDDNGCPYPFYGAAINNRGQVVGYTGHLPDDFQWGFLWTNARDMSIFGSTFWNTFGNGISNSGEIVGENGPEGYATYWKDGVATELGGLSGISEFGGSAANGVNDQGQIVGWSAAMSYIHAVTWTPSGTISDLGTLSGDTDSSASKINLFGLVIGSSGNAVTNSTVIGGQEPGFGPGPLEVIGRPFIWSKAAGMLDLNKLIRPHSGWVLNTATDINLWGQIVGEGTRNGEPHGFLLTPTFF